MKKEINTLFALIRCAVLGEQLSEETKQEAVDKAGLLFKMARHHDMAHLLDYAYKIGGISVPDEQTAFELIKYNAMSVMRYENLNLALVNISELFEKEEIPFIPLKGAVIRDFYPEPWMRTSCDIDILVHEEDLERAEKLLIEKLGYISKEKRGYHDVSLYSDTDVHLELHFNIKENMKNLDGLLSMVWEYASPKTEGSYEYVLSNEFFMFQIVSHISYHVLYGGCSLRYFLDLYLLNQKLEFDENVLFSMLENCGIKTFYDECLRLSTVWFANEKHNETTLLFQEYLLDGGVYGIKKNQIALKRKKKGTFSYILERIFMPYEQLVITYPSLKNKRCLTPLYQVRRWFRVVFNGRIFSSSQELTANGEITDQKIDNIACLFEKIGLDKHC